MDDSRIVGIDIGGTKCAVALARSDGAILDRRSVPTEPHSHTPQATLTCLAELVHALLKEHAVPVKHVRGVGVSCGGPLDRTAGIVHSPPNLPGWEAVPVRSFFERALDLPVRIENDANATALAEWRFGAGRGVRNVVFMTIGTGIGAGLILDGRLYHGSNDLAGEIGHQTLVINGPQCACGKRGCLEALASGPAIARLARESMMYGRQKAVLSLAGGSIAAITAAHVVEAARQGDPFARKILAEAGTYLGLAIAGLIQLLNPERVILGTLAVHAGDLLLDPTREAIAEFAWSRSAAGCTVLPAELGDRAQDLAAVCLWTEEIDAG